jgi:hypothetical protein
MIARRRKIFPIVFLLTCMAAATSTWAKEQSWQLILDGLFRDGTKPLYLYARERNGQWIAVVGSSRDPDRRGGKTYNRRTTTVFWASRTLLPARLTIRPAAIPTWPCARW